MDKKFALKELNKFRKTGDISDYHFSFNKKESGYSVKKVDKDIEISAHTNADLMRAYNYALGLIKEQKNRTVTYCSNFKEVIAMIDLARNAVLSVKTLKSEICRLAGLGYTEIWLYLEDEFEIPSEPYFGMSRGRYSQKQLHDLAVYSDKLGWGRGRYNQRAVAIPGAKRTRPGGDSRRELRRADREAWRLQSPGSQGDRND